MLEIVRSKSKEFSLDIKDGEVITTIPWVSTLEEQVDKIHIHGVFHLLNAEKRIELLEWAYKSLIPNGQLIINVPAWYHGRSYFDPGVQWPPISAEFFMLTNKGFCSINHAIITPAITVTSAIEG